MLARIRRSQSVTCQTISRGHFSSPFIHSRTRTVGSGEGSCCMHMSRQASEARVAVCILEILIELRPPSLVGVPVGQGGVWSAPLGSGYRVGELKCGVTGLAQQQNALSHHPLLKILDRLPRMKRTQTRYQNRCGWRRFMANANASP